MSETRSDSRVVGSLRSIGGGLGALRVEDVYDTGIEDLWSAVTEPERLARWLVVDLEGELRVGGRFEASFTSSWTGPGRIDICEAPHRLLVTLEPDAEGETVIEAVLTAEGERTRLVVEERGHPLDKLPYHGAGWQAHLDDLTSYLAGRDNSGWRERWLALCPAYEELAADLS